MITAGQRTYVNKIARKAHTKRRQTLRSRANNKSKQVIARKAHKKGQIVNSRAKKNTLNSY